MTLRDKIRIGRETWRRCGLVLLTLLTLIHGYGLVLKVMPVPGTLNMKMRLQAAETIKYDWVSLDEISPYLAYAVIGAEDSRFCDHNGIDWRAVEKVLEEREAGKSRRGGSTITQQTAKNVYLWNGGGWLRKLPETWLALYIDTIWSKRRIIEVYLNVAEWGDGNFGAEAAAQARFGKSAQDLTADEAALLAAVLPSPNKWRVNPPGDYVQERAEVLTSRTADVKWGGYGKCVGVDESRMRFPMPKAPVLEPAPNDDSEDQEPEENKEKDNEGQESLEESAPDIATSEDPENFETLLEDIETKLEETRDPDKELPPENENEENIDEPTPDRL